MSKSSHFTVPSPPRSPSRSARHLIHRPAQVSLNMLGDSNANTVHYYVHYIQGTRSQTIVARKYW